MWRASSRLVPAASISSCSPFSRGRCSGLATLYYGLATRIRDIAVPSVQSRKAVALTRSMAYHPAIQFAVADIVLDLEAIGPHLDAVADEWSRGVDYGPLWVVKILAAKYHAVEAAWRIADKGMELSGGFGMFKKNELERLFRDARAGRFHPANSALVHELLGKLSLGINPDEQPRWG